MLTFLPPIPVLTTQSTRYTRCSSVATATTRNHSSRKSQRISTSPHPITTALSSHQSGLATNALFKDSHSVDAWSNFDAQRVSQDPAACRALLRRVVASMRSSPQMFLYWAFALRRCSYFSALKVLTDALLSADAKRLVGTVVKVDLPSHAVLILNVLLEDAESIQAKHYNLPWNYTPAHIESNPVHVARALADLAVDGLSRVRPRIAAASRAAPSWLRGDMYPRYYAQVFHFQSDGWMSPQSASRFQHASEAFFMGIYDASQRNVITVVRAALGARLAGSVERPARGEGRPAIVEVGCGSGRLSTQLRDNFPDARLTVSDASPFYLHEARSAMQHWEALSGGTRARRGSVEFVQMRCEALTALHERSIDVVVMQNVLHELPAPVRKAAVAEAARVLRPGGAFVLSEPLQMGDNERYDETLEDFSRFDEPYFMSYAKTDLVELFAGNGLFECWRRDMRGTTKVLSFKRVH